MEKRRVHRRRVSSRTTVSAVREGAQYDMPDLRWWRAVSACDERRCLSEIQHTSSKSRADALVKHALPRAHLLVQNLAVADSREDDPVVASLP